MAGIFRPDLAQIHVSGRPFATKDEWASPRARRVGLVTQDALLYPHLSVSENLVFSVHSPTTIDTEDPIVEMLEIAPLLKRRVRNLSGGERQRVVLGRALLAQPKLLLLDEPFCAVDQARRMRIIRELDAHLKSTATPAVLVSHDEVVIEAICSQKLTIEQGTMSHNE